MMHCEEGRMGTIQINQFSVSYGNFNLKPVNLTIEQGEIFAILGRTGSGKTVLLEAISGMIAGTSGEIYLGGVSVRNISPGKRKLGLVCQDYGLFPHMKVYDNIVYGLKMHKVSKEEQKRRAEEVMEMLSIGGIRSQYPGTLSGGESQRTALARALVLEPDLLLLDEPFSALDPTTRKTLYKEIRKIHERYHCTIVFVTHDFGEAELLADRVGILLDGKLRAVVGSDQLMKAEFEKDIEGFLGRGKHEEHIL